MKTRDWIELAHAELPVETRETAEHLHAAIAAQVHDQVNEAVASAPDSTPEDDALLAPAVQWQLHLHLARLFTASAEGWAEVFFRNLRERSQR